MKQLKLQRGFIDYFLLRIAEKYSWRIRYPVAACATWLSWWFFAHQFPFAATVFLICAAILTKEVSPSLLLLAAAIWVWPTNFLSTPFGQMTFELLGRVVLSTLLVIASVAITLWVYVAQKNVQPDKRSTGGPSA